MDRKDARAIVEKYHYSHSWPGSAQFQWGVRLGKEIVGVIVFGCGANRHNPQFLGVEDGEYFELLRLWLKDDLPKNAESKVISAAIKMIRKQIPRCRVLLSYADPNVGHNGTIYQATNWIYIGTAAPIGRVQIGDKEYHFRTIHDLYGTKDMKRLKSMFPGKTVKSIKKPGKHTYIYPLDDGMRAKWEKRRRKYPKKK